MKCEKLDVWKAGFIEKETGIQWVKESNEILKMIKGYKKYLQSKGRQ